MHGHRGVEITLHRAPLFAPGIVDMRLTPHNAAGSGEVEAMLSAGVSF
jgi:hypothetical protein